MDTTIETTSPATEPPSSALGRAIALWSTGQNIPLTIAVELMGLGYDLPALERRHRQ